MAFIKDENNDDYLRLDYLDYLRTMLIACAIKLEKELKGQGKSF